MIGGGAAMPEAVAQKLYELVRHHVHGRLRDDRDDLADAHEPARQPEASNAWASRPSTPSRWSSIPTRSSELPPGEVGEIVSRGPQVFKGYWNNPRRPPRRSSSIDGKRFFRTGDLGRFDEDGYFYIVDRLKRMINAAGYKVWPAEVEAMLYTHPDIQEACVDRAPRMRGAARR